ncbi:glycosyltransferase, partial [Streptomyces sp. 2MCAF27]
MRWPRPRRRPAPRARHHGTAAAPRILALIPAHNEAERIAAAIAALHRQDRPPHRIVVVADNCTDATAETAQANGAG